MLEFALHFFITVNKSLENKVNPRHKGALPVKKKQPVIGFSCIIFKPENG